jgi:uncharacterized membrane-anchored protein YitT (DUF2179 family)
MQGHPDEPFDLRRTLRDVAFILIGIASASFGLKGFLLSSHFIDGGVTGICMLLSNGMGWPLAFTLPAINAPFVVLGYRFVGRKFALKSAGAIAGLVAAIAIVPFPDVTSDLLLTAIFGGGFIGAGIGMAMRGGAVLDGTEIAAVLLSSRTPLLKVSDIILILNVVIFGAAALLLGVTPALYSILTYISAAKAVDFLIVGLEQYTGVTIISVKNEEIRKFIVEEMGRGVTAYLGRGGYGRHGERQEMDILFTVVTRLEIPRLRTAALALDPRAFIVQHSIDDAAGGMIKRRPLH